MAARRRAWLLVVGLTLALSGCKDSAIVQKEEVNSPDGYWTARMEIEQFGGMGTADLQTHVYLLRTHGQTEPIEILSFDEPTMASAQVQMNWRDSKHLDVSHFPEAEIEFQAIKCAGVEISLD